ncbi:MAG: acyl-CoA dehydrogenase family protein [Proteobacteria bacterium]|nr:acyl-CoA dehydrogenase family protein [Pseudomonadota bacterium]HQR02767.1 acyl-CoA dehydrogenase family protein [Rhodocyclaceae bacterium]
MNFSFSEEEQQFQHRITEFLEAQQHKPYGADALDFGRWADSQLADTPARREFNRTLAEEGYIGMSWPGKYGGQDMPGIYDYLANEALAQFGAPLIGKGCGIIGKTLMRHGSEKLKQEFLPRILKAEVEFALGYTEPGAGSDLASLQLKATRSEGGWRLNGQKTFNTSAHFADWYWVAARTNPEAPKHKGISLFLLPLTQPGLTITPIHTMGDHRTNAVFFDDVFVSDDYVVGEIDHGWTYICEALDYERFSIYTISPLRKAFDMLCESVRKITRDGVALSQDVQIRRRLARLGTEVEAATLLQRRVLMAAASGAIPSVEAAKFKLYSSELGKRLADAALDILGPQALLRCEAPHAIAEGHWEHLYRATPLDTIGGGTSEIQKNVIARRGLGLPLQN